MLKQRSRLGRGRHADAGGDDLSPASSGIDPAIASRARLLRAGGTTLMAVGGLLSVMLNSNAEGIYPFLANHLPFFADSFVVPMAYMGAGMAAVAVGVRLLHRGQQLIAKSATALLCEDARTPIVYLRSFEFDSLFSQRTQIGEVPSRTTQEQDLVEALSDRGPVIAIGKPGEPLPTLGAARAYVGDDEWRDRVRVFISDAQLIVLATAGTSGLLWELEQAIALGRPESLVLVVPDVRPSYESFRTMTRDLFPHELPQSNDVFARRRFMRFMVKIHFRGMIGFDGAWNPVFSELRYRMAFWKHGRRGDAGTLTRTFREGLSVVRAGHS
jgi:hypothetical protein